MYAVYIIVNTEMFSNGKRSFKSQISVCLNADHLLHSSYPYPLYQRELTKMIIFNLFQKVSHDYKRQLTVFNSVKLSTKLWTIYYLALSTELVVFMDLPPLTAYSISSTAGSLSLKILVVI